MSAKQVILEMIQAMPEDASFPAILAELHARLEDEGEEELSQEEWEAAWVEEINRRVEDVRSGRTKMIPGDEVMGRLREQYG